MAEHADRGNAICARLFIVCESARGHYTGTIKGEVNSKKNKGNQEKKAKPNVNTPLTPICYICDVQDHWSSKCPDEIKDGMRRCHRCNSAEHVIAQCPKGPRRGAEQQSVNYDGRPGDSAKSKSINSQTSSASSATSKEKNKAVSVVDEARGITKQSIDVT